MSKNFENLYRVKTRDDLGDPEYWNKRWEDIDLRVHQTETQLVDLDAIGNRLEGIAIDRINNVITPLVVEAEERMRTVPTLFETSSVTYNTIGIGTKYFTVAASDRNTLATGHFMTVYSTAYPEKWMAATVTSYDNNTGNLVLEVFDSNGTGSYSDWQMTSGGSRGATGSTGWSPNFSVVTDGVRRVLRVVGWIGGTGTPPATTGYLGASGIVPLIGDAVDLRQPAGVTSSVSVFTASAAQTTFAIDGGYASGYITVYQNGVRLVDGVDVITTSLTDIVLTAGATAGDIIVADKISPIEVLGVPTKASQAEAWAGTENVKYSTPLRVAEYVARLFAVTAITVAQTFSVSSSSNVDFTAGQFASVAAASGLSKTYVNIQKGAGYGGAIGGYLNQGVNSGLILSTLNGGTLTDQVWINSGGAFGVGVNPYLNETSFLLYASKNAVLYHDIQNPFIGASAGVVTRYITNNIAGSGTVEANIVKWRNGRWAFENKETGTGAYIAWSIGASGVDNLTLTNAGFLNIGGLAGYPLYVSKAATFDNTMQSLNNTGAVWSKVSFQDTSTTYNPGFGSNGNDLVGLITGSEKFRLSATQLQIFGNVTIPTTGFYTIAGSGVLYQSGSSYTLLQAYLGTGSVQIGNNNDPQTYYNNDTHIFRNKATNAVYFTIANNVLTFPGSSFVMNGATTGLEIGAQGTANSPYIDFHSGATNCDYDVRLQATNGTGTNGQGHLGIYSNYVFIGSSVNAPACQLSALQGVQAHNSTNAQFQLYNTAGATDKKFIRIINSGGDFAFSFVNDAYNGAVISTVISSSAITLSDAINFVFNATTGTKIGTATTQKIGFWNAAPIVQPTTAIAAAAFAANIGTAVNDASTFDGYTMKQVVKALRNSGLLA